MNVPPPTTPPEVTPPAGSRPGAEPWLSVVVPAYNEEKLLPRSLRAIRESLAGWTETGRTWELILCDNASTDATARLAAEAGARVVFEPIRQIARARNRGAAEARGHWLLFIDADSFPSRELMTELGETLQQPDVLGGGALVELESNHGLGLFLTRFWNNVSRLTRWAPGSFLFCRAAAFRELGGFDESLFVSEELDLSRRLKRLARRRGQRMVILRQPLLTSARKLDLYGPRELLRFCLRYLRRPGETARSRDLCHIWYDGRR